MRRVRFCDTGLVNDADLIVIGAGAAGLSAMAELDHAGIRALCIEARDRIGGRILTVHDQLCPVPVELGAEFVHGRPAEIWNIIDSCTLTAYDCTERSFHIKNGQIQHVADAWLLVDEIMEGMQQAAKKGPDQTFSEFLQHNSYSDDAKQLAKSYVEGFNAARANVVGIASLTKEAEAADTIHGDRAFRILNGYDSIPLYLFRSLAGSAERVRLNTAVESIAWNRGSVTLRVRSIHTGEIYRLTSKRVIITAPLGVLQAGTIRFDPEPTRILDATRRLQFGQVVRVILRFSKRVWELNTELGDSGFLLSNEPVFPTWWTPLPMRAPIVVGWSAGPNADPLRGLSREDLISRALQQLSRVLNVDLARLHSSLQSAYYNDWEQDPFSRGAYSYVPAGLIEAREALAEPVEDTLFFAGEATETTGHSGTVHGAIRSGRRAAQQVCSLFRGSREEQR
jgi:monoamine oxidase